MCPDAWRMHGLLILYPHKLKHTVQFWIFFAHSMQFWIGFWKLPLKMVLKQKFIFYSLFALAPCLFGRSAHKSCAFCNRCRCATLTPSAFQASLQLVHKVTERIYHVTLTSPPVCRLRDSYSKFHLTKHTQKCTWCKGSATDVVASVQNAQL